MTDISTASVDSEPATTPPQAIPKPTIDFATLLGIFGGFTVIGLAMYLGGAPDAFIDIPAILIVLGGTLLVTTISYSFREIIGSQGVVFRAVVYNNESPSTAALRVLALSAEARRKGPLSLESFLDDLTHARFLQQALVLVIDGAPGEEIDQVLSREIDATAQRHLRSAGVLRRAGEVAPAMGLIGTLVGLVQMLGNLEDPSSIGPAMAVALLTTFYGAILANMVFLPLASKLERNSQVEIAVNQIYATGAGSISRQENPRRLELVLNTILPPSQRVRFFD